MIVQPDSSVVLAAPAASRAASRYRAILLSTIIAVGFVLRPVYVFHLKFNTDEPQHMHVVWAWTQGLVQYRDLADNHSPLFYLIFAPLMALMPSTSAALPLMRILMLPMYGLAILCVYRLGKLLFDRNVGLWSALLIAVFPIFYRRSIDFRPDQLWMLTWCAALVVFARGLRRPGQAFVFGLLVGTCFAISMKTTVLLTSLVLAMGMTRIICGARSARPLQQYAAMIGAAVLGILCMPAAMIFWFWHLGALRDLYIGTIGSNYMPGDKSGLSLWHVALFLILASLCIYILRRNVRGKTPGARARRRIVLICTAFVSTALFKTVWPLFEPQDWLVLSPLIMVSVVGIVAFSGRCWAASIAAVPRWFDLAAMGTAVVFAAVVISQAPFHDGGQVSRGIVDEVCRLTDPGQAVIDAKGESIFRPRAIRDVYESLTRRRLSRHLIADTGPSEIVAAHAFVAVFNSDRYPDETRDFIAANFLPVGKVYVAGLRLDGRPENANGEIAFHIALPGTYKFEMKDGVAAGTIDAKPITGPLDLTAGEHLYRPAPGQLAAPCALVWDQVAQRGASVRWNPISAAK